MDTDFFFPWKIHRPELTAHAQTLPHGEVDKPNQAPSFLTLDWILAWTAGELRS